MPLDAEHWKTFLPLVQAFAEGKEIQYRLGEEWPWTSQVIAAFCGDINDYRIKPEKKNGWIAIHGSSLGTLEGCLVKLASNVFKNRDDLVKQYPRANAYIEVEWDE